VTIPTSADTAKSSWPAAGKSAKKRTVVAVARQLSVLLHRLRVTGEAYDPLRNAGLPRRERLQGA
jgi:hypothetical protein